MVMPKLLLTMMLLMPLILLTMILDPHTQKSSYSFKNCNHAPDSADDDSASPDSIVDSKLKRKIDPRSIIKLIYIYIRQ